MTPADLGRTSRQATKTPERVVSLVPSLTESLFDLGLGDRVVAATDYCVHPAEALRGVPRIGGTKNPRLEAIVALRPDLVLANREENRPEDVAFLEESGLEVWVTFPRKVREALDVLWEILRRFDALEMGQRLATVEHILDWTRAAAGAHAPAPVFCPIWRSGVWPEAWWMTANGDTYMHDLLAVCGGRNVFADRRRQYPLAADLGRLERNAGPKRPVVERDERYPRVTFAEVLDARPAIILLPSEPYPFGEADREEWLAVRSLPAAASDRVHLVDGSLLTWHGTRLARALQEIPPLLAPA